MFKIRNLSADENKRVRLTPKGENTFQAISDPELIVVEPNGSIAFCLSPDTSSDPSNVRGFVLGYHRDELHGIILMAPEWNLSEDSGSVAIRLKGKYTNEADGWFESTLWNQGNAIPGTGEQYITLNFGSNGVAVEDVNAEWEVKVVNGDYVIRTEYYGNPNRPSHTAGLEIPGGNPPYLRSVIVDQNFIIPGAEYALAISQQQWEQEVIFVCPPEPDILTRTFVDYVENETGNWDEVDRQETGFYWGDVNPGRWQTVYGYSTGVFGKYQGKHTGFADFIYVY